MKRKKKSSTLQQAMEQDHRVGALVAKWRSMTETKRRIIFLKVVWMSSSQRLWLFDSYPAHLATVIGGVRLVEG